MLFPSIVSGVQRRREKKPTLQKAINAIPRIELRDGGLRHAP
jgi:hypothetical protein